MECRRPEIIRIRNQPEDGLYPNRWGTLFVTISPEDFEKNFDSMNVPKDKVKWYLWTHSVTKRDKGIVGPIYTAIIALDERGSILGNPSGYLPFFDQCEHKDRREGTTRYSLQLLYPALLALAFLGCKNVARAECQPDKQVNRERRKAGLRPFVRYHTINIEPMKRVLKTEGNVETEGLKRALSTSAAATSRPTPRRSRYSAGSPGRSGFRPTSEVPRSKAS